MVKEIEEFKCKENLWQILPIEDRQLQLEILCSVQIDRETILIFGGVNQHIRDSKKCFAFNTKDHSISPKSPLAVPQVYINCPVYHNGKVFVIGNEYYVKKRRIQIYDVAKDKWRLLF